MYKVRFVFVEKGVQAYAIKQN